MSAEMMLPSRGEIVSARQAQMAMEETKRAEDALRRLGELKERIRELVAYEVSTYRAIVDAGLQDAVKGVRDLNLLDKFSKMSEAHLNDVCETCIRMGVSLRYYFESHRKEEQRMKLLTDAQNELNGVVDDYKKTGFAVMPPSVSVRNRNDALGAAMVGLRKVTRDRLLQAGAVGIGDGKYVNPKEHQHEVWLALIERADQTKADMMSVARLYHALDHKLGEDEIECLDRHAFPGFCSACEALAGDAIA